MRDQLQSTKVVVISSEELESLITRAVQAALVNQPAADDYLGLAEAATLLGVHRRTVRTWVNTEGLPAIRLGPVEMRFRRADLVAWLDSRVSKPGGHVSRHVERLGRVRADKAHASKVAP